MTEKLYVDASLFSESKFSEEKIFLTDKIVVSLAQEGFTQITATISKPAM